MGETTQTQYAAIVDAYRTRLHDRHIHLAPDIPPKKLSGAIDSYAPGVAEDEVLALVDSTVRGGARDGALLTRTALHGHEPGGQPVKVLLHDIRELATDQRVTGTVVMADGQRVFSAALAAFDKVEVFVDLVRDVARRAGAAEVPAQRIPARAPAPDATVADPDGEAEVPLELCHLVRAEWHRDVFDRSAPGRSVTSSLMVIRPPEGRLREVRTCPRCQTRLDILVYSYRLLRRYRAVGWSMLAAGAVFLVLALALQDAWVGADSSAVRVAGGAVAVAALTAVLVGGGLVWWAGRLLGTQGVQVGQVGRDDRRQVGHATHSVSLRG